MPETALALAAAYLLGAMPFGLLAGWLAGKDVRKEGSGNIGATNVGRVCGWLWGVPVFALDFLKGFAAVFWLAPWALAQEHASAGSACPWLAVGCGLAAILGHNFPVWLKFRGGKGVATSAGVLLALLPMEFGVALGMFIAVAAVSRYVSLGSLCAAAALPLARALFALWRDDQSPFTSAQMPLTLAALTMCGLVFLRHRANIQRLLAGTENRLGARATCCPATNDAQTPASGERFIAMSAHSLRRQRQPRKADEHGSAAVILVISLAFLLLAGIGYAVPPSPPPSAKTNREDEIEMAGDGKGEWRLLCAKPSQATTMDEKICRQIQYSRNYFLAVGLIGCAVFLLLRRHGTDNDKGGEKIG